ncbi:unnamed protein product [Rotaria sordida]|uniref:Uncharacterized protein n=1 Tax=Rotaria sordida TaxID=392033 RepID=A0A814SGD9_9BILA|nr:unnamed protein product [Rotaria sordida]
MLIDEQNVDEIITTIRTLHQTSIDQRRYDLTEYLIEFFQLIKQDQQINLLNTFHLLTNLLRDYVDRAALKIEFLKAKCLEIIYEILINETNNENNIISIIQFISELLINSENVQEKFLDFNGYEKIFHFLDHVYSPTIDFINQLLILMTEKTSLQIDNSLTPVDILVHFINPHIAVILIHWIPHIIDISHQHHIIHSINIIVSRSLQNKMMACSNNIIYSLINILFFNKFNDKILLDNIFSILEKLARFSINTKEIRHICQLFNENTPFKKQLLRILITAAKHDDPDTQTISSYFDLQRANSGIILPVIRRWPSISSSSLHFSFHCWLRLNHELESYSYDVRRQIYSFYSDSIGLESFIRNSSIYVLVNDRRELAYIEINDCDELMDGCWHSLTIIHTAQRPSLFVAAFQAVSTCYLTVYIDGLLKKQIKDFKYIPLIQDPISLASIGAPSQRPRLLTMNAKNDSLHISTTIAKTMQPFKGLFSSKPKTPNIRPENQLLNGQNNVIIIEPNSQDAIFGESSSLYGQLASIWILAETLNEAQVKHLHSMGADFCHQHHPLPSGDSSMSSIIFDLLSTRSLLVYHPLACNGQICVDISACTSQMNGRLNNGSCLRLRSFSESLLNLGGCPVLYPLFEKFQETDCSDRIYTDNISSSSSSNNFESPTDWIIVRRQSQRNLSNIDNRLISNPIASIINLFRCVLSSISMKILTEQMTKRYNIELLGLHLNRISSFFIDQQLLIAIQQLIECSRLNTSSHVLTNQLIQYILLDFSLWNKAKHDVRISHLQYIAAVIKDEKKYYRTKFGVQYFLDVIRQHFNAASLDVRYVAMRKLMTCFIAHPSVCRSYAKCHGWQETLVHFFIKSRRSTSMQSSQCLTSSNVSNDVSVTCKTDQSIDSGRESSNSTITDNGDLPTLLISPQIFETSSNPEDLTQERLLRQNDLSPTTDETMHLDLTQILASPRPSLTSTSALSSMNILIDKDITPEFQQNKLGIRRSLLQSSSTSNEDLLSLIKADNSLDDFPSMTSSTDVICTLPRTTTMTSVTSTEDTSFFVPSQANPEDGGLLEELCETLILTIVMILWKGITGSDDEAWIIRGQVFSALHYLHRDYEFYLPIVYIERRILELSMETCLNDLRASGGKTTSTYENNCRELIKIVDDFLSQTTETNDRITENFINGILPILDTMLIFEENGTGDQTASTLISHDEHWTETSLTGLNILLNLLSHSNVSYCGPASVRIHSLLHSRPLNGREEAAYLLSNVNTVISSISQNEDCEHFGYLLPIMKTIIDKSYEILQMNVQIPNVPLRKATSTALDDFRQYCSASNSQEWQMFIQRHIEPLAEHYRSMSIRPFHMNMKIWWNNCYEMMMVGIHKRNRQIGEEKLKFQSHIVEQWHQRRRSDQQRILTLAKQRRIHQIHVEHEWRDREKYINGERGPWWNEKINKERHWKLSDRENIHRMRCKLIENNDFNKHDEASRLRDNLGIDSIDESRQSLLEESLKNKSLLIQQESLRGNSIDEQEFLAVANETQSLLLEEKEKMIIGAQCSLITSTSVTDGKLEITNRYVYFFDSTPQKSCEKDFKYPLSWLQDVQLRRYNLRPSALEFFLLNHTNFLMNFDKKIRRQVYQKIMSLKLPGMKSLYSNLSITITPQDMLKESKLTEKWVTREISNYDYLMMLNTIAGRTYNDLNQYPIFPWILKDYSSDVLDISDPDVFRDFSKPIGIQNPKHMEEVRLKYESFDDPTGLMKKFHYGTHYSNAASVMHYLIRMEPFTTLHIQLQSGKFDIADRQFHSFQSAWLNIMDSPNEVKELIPEFFYLPEFLINSNKFDLGKLQITNQVLNDVQLPPWAYNSPEEFIRIHRLALESDYVSSHLHEWIDLIFGYKQTGQAAIDALNVFMYCSYEKAVDVDAIEDTVTREAIEGMIQNFGQIPSQLLTEPHPQRQTCEQAAFEIESQGRALNIFQNLSHIRAFFVEITPANDKLCDPITFISIPKNQVRSFMQQGIPDTLITVSVSGVVGNNGWQPYDKSLSHFFTFERDPTLQTERNRHIIAAPFAPSLEINSHLFAVSHDAKFVFSGGHWDWSLRVYSLLKSKMVGSLIHHTDIITCLTLDSTGCILVTGSRDTTCVIWNISLHDNRHLNNLSDQEYNSLISPNITLYGHPTEVTCICVSTELDLVISGSLDGSCNIHTVEHGIYLRTLRPIGDPIMNLQLSDERHILIQTEKDDTHLFLYTINGDLVRTRKLEYHIVDMLLSDQHIVLAVNHIPLLQQQTNKTTNKESTSLTAARIVIKDMFDMKTIQTIRLRTHINCLYFTKDFSHLLVGVKDGKLIVLTAEKKSLTKTVTKNN